MAWATLSYVAPLPERETAVPYARRSRRPTPGGRHPGREAGFASAGPVPAPPGGGAGRRGGHAARWLSASCSSRGTCCSARSSAASWPPPAPKCPGTREPVILPCWSWAVPGRRTGSASSYDAGFRCLPTAHTFRWSCCARHAKLVRRRSRTLRWKHGCRISLTHGGAVRCAPTPRLDRRSWLFRRDLHLDLPRLRLLRPRERHGQNAVLVARLDVAGVHSRRQGKAALERAIRPFVAVYPLRPLLGDLLLRAADREN